jgi:hypothetical protein
MTQNAGFWGKARGVSTNCEMIANSCLNTERETFNRTHPCNPCNPWLGFFGLSFLPIQVDLRCNWRRSLPFYFTAGACSACNSCVAAV